MRDELKSLILDSNEAMKDWGWCTPEKALAMSNLILDQKPAVVVEVGVFAGRSVIPQAMSLRENGGGMIFAIDPWKKEAALEGENAKENDDWWANLDLHNVHKVAMEFIWRWDLDAHATVIRNASQHVARLFPNIDILHIDGCHSELVSCRDVDLYVPRVVKGGHIWFDDTNWATTKAAIDKLHKVADKIGQVGDCALFRKR
jgi:predicted O-methyltransferase YrrM